MKNLFALLFLAGLISFSSCENASEQSAENEVEVPAEAPVVEEEAPAVVEEAPVESNEEADTTVAE